MGYTYRCTCGALWDDDGQLIKAGRDLCESCQWHYFSPQTEATFRRNGEFVIEFSEN